MTQDLLRKSEETNGVRNGGAILTHPLGHLLLRKASLYDQPLKGLRFFKWIQVLTLDVLNQCPFQEIIPSHFLDHGRNLLKP